MSRKDFSYRIEQKIGFDKVRELAAAKCSTRYGIERAENERFSSDIDIVEKRLNLTDEMRTIILFETSFPSSGYIDSIEFLKPLEVKSSYLVRESVAKLRTSEEVVSKILSFFKNAKEDRYPALKKMSEKIVVFPEIRRRIDIILDRYGEIRDNASPELLEIRRTLKSTETAVSRKIENIMKRAKEEGIVEEESSLSVREGRTLIPVSAVNKKKLNGFILDESSTGKTVFIEPVEVVEMNNKIKELHFEEQREIVRILVEFSDFLRPYLPDLIETARYLGELDYIRAKASLALEMEAGKPIISKDNEIILKDARHPLLEKALKKENKSIVPLNLALNTHKRILLISGPNAGGKSVCLKTLGLLQYMLQTGYLISTSEVSELRLFKSIFIDIGDEQSIENDLSTYSSHLMNMKAMLEGADENSLILIDEFGSGTEPTAGGAIAEAILEEIENRQSFGVITTHYSNLKFYASNSSGVINGAMLFDIQKIQPLFKLEIGLPGSSFAFELARKMGLPESIIKAAEEKSGEEFVNVERHLRKIAKSKRDLDRKLARIRTTDKTLENVTDKYQKELEEIHSKRQTIIAEAKKEAAEILAKTNRQIEKTIKDIKESQAEKEKTKLARKKLDEFKDDFIANDTDEQEARLRKKMEQLKERQQKREERKRRGQAAETTEQPKAVVVPIEKGGFVRLANGMTGEVLEMDGKKATVAIGAIKSIMKLSELKGISRNEFSARKKEERKSAPITYNDFGISERRLNFKASADVRGYRLEEAIDVVSKLVDDAIMFDINQVRILHGKGNGILKEGLRNYLKPFPALFHVKTNLSDRKSVV